LKIEDFDFERETLRIVQSKRSKDRIAPFLREGKSVIENWIKYSGATDYLFPSYESHSMATIDKQHISAKTITNGFNKVLKKANLQREDERYKSQKKRKKFTFHTFRHTFCTHHLENDVSLALISRAAGHSKMDTTVHVYGHMATGTIVRAFRQSFDKGKKANPEKKVTKKTDAGYDPLKELAQKFISGEISEGVFKNKKQALEEAGF